MLNEVEHHVGEIRKLRQVQDYIDEHQDYLRQKIQHLDSSIRMGVLSNFEKNEQKKLKKFLQGLLQSNARPEPTMIPPYFG